MDRASGDVGEEPDTEFIRNENGDWLLTLPARAGEPDEPVLLVDAAQATALLRRAPGEDVRLPGLHPSVAGSLGDHGMLLVAEHQAGSVVRLYEAVIGEGALA